MYWYAVFSLCVCTQSIPPQQIKQPLPEYMVPADAVKLCKQVTTTLQHYIIACTTLKEIVYRKPLLNCIFTAALTSLSNNYCNHFHSYLSIHRMVTLIVH